jgi:hypothetical protein
MQMSPYHKHSVFLELPGIEYFRFEEDFVEQNIRCIPMIVRFNMDAAGIKLKLLEWSRFDPGDRIELATRPCTSADEVSAYKTYLIGLIRKKTGKEASTMEVDENPFWRPINHVPSLLREKANEFGWVISVNQWKDLTQLQRFALLKLCRPGHENRNFPRAMKEFGLVAE